MRIGVFRLSPVDFFAKPVNKTREAAFDVGVIHDNQRVWPVATWAALGRHLSFNRIHWYSIFMPYNYRIFRSFIKKLSLISSFLAMLFTCKSNSKIVDAPNDSSMEALNDADPLYKVFVELRREHSVSHECQRNTQKLIVAFEQVKSFLVDDATVLFFHAPDPHVKFIQVYASFMNRFRWEYHVALAFHGKVYDTSFRKQPAVLATNDYLREMFLGSKDPLPEPQNGNLVIIKQIPAVMWRDKLGKSDGGTTYDIPFFLDTKRFKPQSINKYLGTASPK